MTVAAPLKEDYGEDAGIQMILIVDDDPEFLQRAGAILNHERRVFLATNSKQAFELAKNLGFSVVLIDLDLQQEDGLVLIREIHERFPGLPVIAISTSSRKVVLELAQEFGAVEVLQKPATPTWKPVVERIRAMAARE